MSNSNDSDGKYVVVQNGKRVSDLHDNQAEALRQAEKLRGKVTESSGKQSIVEVKQNLFG